MAKTRIGVVDYLNSGPLVHGLDRERTVELVYDTPAALSRKLRKGELDIALVSSIECFRYPDLRILPEIGICSEGPIKSIKLYSRRSLSRVERVALDRGSRSAATLTKITIQEFYQQPEATFTEIAPTLNPTEVSADATLLIGDAALKADPGHLKVTDLGALWTERTGLPFVYAVWTCRKNLRTDRILPILLRARDRGLPERPRLAQRAAQELGLPAAGLVQYLTKNLRYHLGEREIKGMERFRDIASELELCNRHDVPFSGARVQPVF
jgi:chorismate dehydratase